MPTHGQQFNAHLEPCFGANVSDEARARLNPQFEPASIKLPRSPRMSAAMVEKRWEQIGAHPVDKEQILDPQTLAQLDAYAANIEYGIGTVKVPLGIAGPLRVNGLHAKGDYLLPLATSEAALVASYHRGALAISESGGCTAMLVDEGVSRSPGFAFPTSREAGAFLSWVLQREADLQAVAGSTSRFGRLKGLRVSIHGSYVFLILDFYTGDASGQNMVTLATEAVCRWILEHCPVKPSHYYVEANHSGDKKSTAQSYLSVRGKKVTADVVIPRRVVEQRLASTPEAMVEYLRMAAVGAMLSGTMGVNGHYANALAALYIACGQDAACVAESAIGNTRFDITEQGDLYATVTLPNLIVGTVGGGTGLPSQHVCLKLMDLAGPGKARAFAEVAAGLVLAGELSIISALSVGHFARAHRKLGRERTPRPAAPALEE